jgi:hypothetical protein
LVGVAALLMQLAPAASAAGVCSSSTPQYCPPPVVTTGAAVAVTFHSATLTGTVNPNGAPTTCAFAYGLSTTQTVSASTASPGSGSSAVTVTASIDGLEASTHFHVALLCSNAGGVGFGSDVPFTTLDHGPSKVAFSGATAFVASNRTGGIFLGCYGDRGCAGTMTLRSGRKTIATSSYSIGANSGLIVHFSISKATLAQIRKHKSIKVACTAVDGDGPKASATVALHVFT